MTIFENVIKAGNHRPNAKYFVGFDNNQYGRLLAEVKKHKDFGGDCSSVLPNAVSGVNNWCNRGFFTNNGDANRIAFAYSVYSYSPVVLLYYICDNMNDLENVSYIPWIPSGLFI